MLDNPIILILIILLLLWLASRFFSNRAPTTPSYDDKDIRSGGSIGGGPGMPGQRTHDDPTIESGGSIGGRGGNVTARTHDDPNIRSGGSIGGSNVYREESRPPVGGGVERDSDIGERRNPFTSGSGQSVSSSTVENLRNRATDMRDERDDDDRARRDDDDNPPRRRGGNDDPNVRSGGSFGD
jgi:hypothetical protein